MKDGQALHVNGVGIPSIFGGVGLARGDVAETPASLILDFAGPNMGVSFGWSVFAGCAFFRGFITLRGLLS